MDSRELTRHERAAIRKLVTGMCANYDPDYGCLTLDCECYMLNKWRTGAYCKYFESSVLPLDLALEISLTGRGPRRKTIVQPVVSRMCRRADRRIVSRPVLPPRGDNASGDICEKNGPTASF